MGRWLEALKNHENAPEANPQNPQNPTSGSNGMATVDQQRAHAVSDSTDAMKPTLSGGEADKGTQIVHTHRAPPVYAHRNPVRQIMERLEGDMELYSEALRFHGPMSYGQAMYVLGWGATRAGMAEQDLRKAGRITFNHLGRAVLVDPEGEANAD